MAGLTAYYSWRLIFMTFNGHARWGHDDGHHGHSLADDHGPADKPAHASGAQHETHTEPDTNPDHDISRTKAPG